MGLNINSPLLSSSQNLLEQSKEFSLVSNLSLKTRDEQKTKITIYSSKIETIVSVCSVPYSMFFCGNNGIPKFRWSMLDSQEINVLSLFTWRCPLPQTKPREETEPASYNPLIHCIACVWVRKLVSMCARERERERRTGIVNSVMWLPGLCCYQSVMWILNIHKVPFPKNKDNSNVR